MITRAATAPILVNENHMNLRKLRKNGFGTNILSKEANFLLFPKGSTTIRNVTHAMKGGVIEKFLGLIN